MRFEVVSTMSICVFNNFSWLFFLCKNMQLSKVDLEKLKAIHLKHTGVLLTDEEALELGLKLINLHKITLKPVPEDYSVEKDKNWQ